MKQLQPNNHRISNSLFEAITQVTSGKSNEAADNAGAAVDRAHFCATHVEHALLGQGTCISEQHAEPDENGNVAWYNVQFPSGIQKVETSSLKIVEGKSHTHGKKMAEETVEEANDGNLANNAKPYNKVTHGDVIAGRLGKDEMGGKKKVKEEVDAVEEGILDTAKTVAKKALEKLGHPSDEEMLKKLAKDSGATKQKMGEEVEEDLDEASKGMKLKAPGGKMNKIAAAVATRYSSRTAGRKAGLVKSALRKEENELDESISETIVKHNDFSIEITDNPTFGDFLRAVQTIVPTNEEAVQLEVVAIAEQAFAENYEDVIIEAFTRSEIEDKISAHKKAGNLVSNDKYGTRDGKPYAEYVVTDTEGGRKKYIHHGSVRRLESMPATTKKA